MVRGLRKSWAATSRLESSGNETGDLDFLRGQLSDRRRFPLRTAFARGAQLSTSLFGHGAAPSVAKVSYAARR